MTTHARPPRKKTKPGQRWGDVTVLERADVPAGANPRQTWWRVHCARCGETSTVSANVFRQNGACGCRGRDQKNKRERIEQIVCAHYEAKGPTWCAREAKCALTTIRRFAKEHNLTPPPPSVARAALQTRKDDQKKPRSNKRAAEIAIQKIKPQWPNIKKDPIAKLFFYVVAQAIQDLGRKTTGGCRHNQDKTNREYRNDAIDYLSGEIHHAEAFGVDSGWIRSVIRKCGLTLEKDPDPEQEQTNE